MRESIIDLSQQRTARIARLKREYTRSVTEARVRADAMEELVRRAGICPELERQEAEYRALVCRIERQLQAVAAAEGLEVSAYPAEVVLDGFLGHGS